MLVACSSNGDLQGVWEGDQYDLEIDEDVISIVGHVPLEIEYEHVSGDEYEVTFLDETETIVLEVDGDQLTMESVFSGESEVFERAE